MSRFFLSNVARRPDVIFGTENCHIRMSSLHEAGMLLCIYTQDKPKSSSSFIPIYWLSWLLPMFIGVSLLNWRSYLLIQHSIGLARVRTDNPFHTPSVEIQATSMVFLLAPREVPSHAQRWTIILNLFRFLSWRPEPQCHLVKVCCLV